MISFESDYIAGAHPEVLKRLTETNMESLPGYGSDPYCESAKRKIRESIGMPEAEVYFLTGGTQTNTAERRKDRGRDAERISEGLLR